MRVTYNSNNSGGSWWLEDKDWKTLEEAGWTVIWGGYYFCHSNWAKAPKGKNEPCEPGEDCNGHRKYENWKAVGKDRYIGSALAKEAYKDFNSPAEALREFEKITGQSVMDEGCNCCGSPHSFRWESGSASGEECGEHIYGDEAKLTKRELIKKLKEKA